MRGIINKDLIKSKNMDGRRRSNIKIGLHVAIVQKHDQKTEKITEGMVANVLTNSAFHPHGIKVRLQNGNIGRVKEVFGVHKIEKPRD